MKFDRWQSSTECRLLKHLQRRGWVSMMHFTRWFVKFAKIRREGKSTEERDLVAVKIVDSDVNCFKGYASIKFYHKNSNMSPASMHHCHLYIYFNFSSFSQLPWYDDSIIAAAHYLLLEKHPTNENINFLSSLCNIYKHLSMQ